MDRDNLILFLLDFYCKSNNLHEKYDEIIDILKSENMINVDTSKWVVPAILQKQSQKILFPSNFEIEGKIGEGSYGTITKVFNKLDQQHYALKIIENEDNLEEDKFLREIRLLAFLDHPNIVRYHTSWVDSNKLFYIMELCDKNLTKYIEIRDILDDFTNKKIFKQIGNGVSYIHSKGILHRDLTTNNILMKDNIVKIADFGLSIKKENPKQITMGSDEYGTISYLAPECVKMNHYSVYTDYYALGIILFLLYSQFATQMEKYKSLENLREMKKVDKYFNVNFPDIVKIIFDLIEIEPTKRKIDF